MADLGTFKTWNEFQAKHKNGKIGDTATVDGRAYVWNPTSNVWILNPMAAGTRTEVGASGYKPITQGGVTLTTEFPQNKPLPSGRIKDLNFEIYDGTMGIGATGVPGSSFQANIPQPAKINASDYFQSFFDPKKKNEVKALQTKLQAMNVLGNNFTPGMFDKPTQLALTQQLVLMSQYASPEHNVQTWFGPNSSQIFGNGNGTSSTSTNIQRHEYSANTLKEAVNAAYQNAVGRDATAKEITDAVNAVNAASKKNPSKTVTTSKGSTTTSVSSGGVNAGQVITDQAKNNPEFGSYQAATTYFDALINAMRAPVGTGA